LRHFLEPLPTYRAFFVTIQNQKDQNKSYYKIKYFCNYDTDLKFNSTYIEKVCPGEERRDEHSHIRSSEGSILIWS
jgi:hypothetical protein